MSDIKDIIFYLLVGLGIGSLYAMLGSGLVVAYKGSGVINFAHGALAMYGAFQFDELWSRGNIQLPWFDIIPGHGPNLPVEIHFVDDGVPFIVALLGALAFAALLGFLVHALVFKPLRNAAPLGKVVGSLGVMIYLQGVALLNFGSDFRQPRGVLPDEPIKNFLWLGENRQFPRNALYCSAIAIAIGVALWLIYRYTRFGLATRAAAGNEKGAVLLGYSPEFLAKINWMFASTIAAIAAIVVGPIQGTLTPVGLTALVVPALGAALIGGLNSIILATVGGFLLGMVQSCFSTELISYSWFPNFLINGVREAVPLVAIALVLYFRGKKLPIRGTVEERRLPLCPKPVRVVPHSIVWGALVIAAAFTFTGKWSFGLTTSLITAILMLSFVVVTGYVGQISLAQLTLAGVAAFFMAKMLANNTSDAVNPFPVWGPDLPWPIAMVLGIAVAIAIGVLLGIPALRIRGVQLAVVTIAASLSVQTLYFENAELTGIRAGAPAAVSKPSFFGLDISSVGDRGLTDRPAFVIFALVMLLLMIYVVVNIRRSGTGRRFLSVRANERAAAAAGVNVARTKLLAFGIGAGIAGVSGCMLAFQQQSISSANFVALAGLALLAFGYLGGITSINGAIVAAFLLAPAGLSQVFNSHHFAKANIELYSTILGGLGLILTAIIHPEGIAPFFQPLFRALGNFIVKARGKEWLGVLKRLGPVALLGAVLGYIIWPMRVDSYKDGWMMLLGALIALFVRANIMRGIHGSREKKAEKARLEAEGAALAARAARSSAPVPAEV